MDPVKSYDTVILGSGAGGSTLAHELARTGRNILVVERGGFLPREKENWDPAEVFLKGKYNCDEQCIDKDGTALEIGRETWRERV